MSSELKLVKKQIQLAKSQLSFVLDSRIQTLSVVQGTVLIALEGVSLLLSKYSPHLGLKGVEARLLSTSNKIQLSEPELVKLGNHGELVPLFEESDSWLCKLLQLKKSFNRQMVNKKPIFGVFEHESETQITTGGEPTGLIATSSGSSAVVHWQSVGVEELVELLEQFEQFVLHLEAISVEY